MPNQALKVAMIGGGLNSAVGRVHEIALKMDGQFELCAGCFSLEDDVNKATAKAYSIPAHRVYVTAEELLKNEVENLDVVIIATPIDSHHSLINLVLDHNLKVVCEKSIVSNMEESLQISERVGSQSTDLYSVFNYTGYPAVREIKQRVESGEIGHVFKIMAEMPQDSYMRMKNSDRINYIQPWRLHDGNIPCVSLDLCTHLHSLIYFITNNTPRSVTAKQRSVSDVSQGLIDEVDAIVTYENDLLVNFWYGKVALGYRNGLRLRVFGTKGSFEWLQEDPEIILAANAQGDRLVIDRISSTSTISCQERYNRFKAGHPSGFLEAFANYYVDIAGAIRAENLNKYTLDVDVALEGVRLCDAISKASISNTEVSL